MFTNHSADPISEKLDDFFRENSIEKEEEIRLALISTENSNMIESLIEEYEKLNEGISQEYNSKENLNLTVNQKEMKRQKLRQIFSLLIQEKEEISEFIFQRLIKISLNSKKITELLQIFTEKEKDNLIFELFTNLNICSYGDYEDCLFVVAEYFSRHQSKYELIFNFLQISAQREIYSFYPVFSLCLRNFSKSSKFDQAIMLINYMMYYQIEVSTCALNYLIESLCRVNRFQEAQSIFNKFLNYEPRYVFPEDAIKVCKFSKLTLNSKVNIITYGTLIKCLCKANLMELALYYYEILKKDDLIKDEVIFNLLIDGCSKSQNIEQLKSVYYDMLNLSITPTIVTFNTIIDAYIRFKDLPSSWKIYEDIVKNRIKPDNFTFSTLFRGIRQSSHREYLYKSLQILEDLKSNNEQIDIILINVLLDSCIAMKEEKSTIELFEKVRTGYFTPVIPDIITFNTFIKGCAQMNLLESAREAYNYMFTLSFIKPNDVTFNTMIDVCVRSSKMPEVWTIIEKMKEYGIKPDNFTYSTIIKGLNKNTNLNIIDNHEETQEDSQTQTDRQFKDKSPSELELAFKLFENVKNFSKPDEILYNCIMDACLRFEKIDKMMELYDEMIFEKIKPSSITCGIIIKAYGMKGKLTKALEVYEEMKRENIEISSITYGCLINACIKNDNLNKAFELYEELAKNKIQMNIVLYTTLIKAYSKTKNLHKVLEIFNKMKRDKNNSPNNVTFNSVIDCCIKCDEIKLSEKIFEEMKISGIKPDIVTFSTLIKGCLKKSELNKAIEYLNTMQKYGIKPDEVLLNSLLDGCEKMRKFGKAVEIFNYVRNFHVEPTMMSFSIMMKIYGKLNDFTASKALIEEVKKKNKNISLIIFTCYMKTCFSTDNLEEAISIYNQLPKLKLVPDSITYLTMINGLMGVNRKKNHNLDRLIFDLIKESLSKNILLNYNCYMDVVKKLQNSNEDPGILSELTELLRSHDIEINSNLNERYGTKNKNTSFKGDNINYLIDGYKHKSGGNHANTKNKLVRAEIIGSDENTRLSNKIPLMQIEKHAISSEKEYNLNNLAGANTTNNCISNKTTHKITTAYTSNQSKDNFSFCNWNVKKDNINSKTNFHNLEQSERRGHEMINENSTTSSRNLFSSYKDDVKQPGKNKKFNRF
jgi:pentatricopeptide repeat protein